MRIGIDARLWDQTGVGRYIKNLVEHLYKIDKKNSYVLFVGKDSSAVVKNKNWKIVQTDIPWHSVREQIFFPKVLGKENLDIMHFPYISSPLFYGRPFIVTIHDLTPYYYSTGKASTLWYPAYLVKKLGYRFVLSNSILNSEKIIVPSFAIKNGLLKFIKIEKEKIEVTYEGIDEKLKIKSGLQKEYGKYILYVGNAYPHKNLDTLVLSLSKLKGSKVKLVIVGKEDFFIKRVKKLADKLKVTDDLIFTGQVSDEKLSQLYTNAICTVVPSFSEGFSLPVLEAMSLRCPVLISDIEVHREIAKDSAIYFDPNSVSDLQNKLNQIINKKIDLKENTQKAYEISKNFSWEQTARQTLKIYESL